MIITVTVNSGYVTVTLRKLRAPIMMCTGGSIDRLVLTHVDQINGFVTDSFLSTHLRHEHLLTLTLIVLDQGHSFFHNWRQIGE
jgi:hypothetical protein